LGYKQQCGDFTDQQACYPVEFARAERGVRDLRVSTIMKIARGLEIEPARLLDGLGSR
jgi:hypothetical protein